MSVLSQAILLGFSNSSSQSYWFLTVGDSNSNTGNDVAIDGDGTDSGATSATYSDQCAGVGNPSGCTQITGADNGGGSITNDGGTAVWDLTNSFATVTFGANNKKWALDWTGFTDMTKLCVKCVNAYDISSGIYIFDFAELHLKIYFTAPEVFYGRTKLRSGSMTLKAGKLTIK